jgi:dTDP-4-dehydrorhamnose 3,5-epimerase
MIPGVEVIPLTTHVDERGFFREILKSNQITKFGQWSMSWMVQDTIKAWHIHQVQTDYFFVVSGMVKVVLCDLRKWENPQNIARDLGEFAKNIKGFEEFILGDNQTPQVLVIPPGVAHGLKVLQGPAVLMYVTSEMYDPQDEGRIPYNSLGYNWDAREVR